MPKKFIKDHEEEWGFLAKHIIPQLTEQPDYWCQITVPNEFQAVGKYNIGLTAGIETTVCDGSWIEGCNRMDLILTSSNHSKRVFETCEFLKDGKEDQVIKLNKPIKVLFEGANLDVYKKVSKFTNEGLFNHINDIPEEYAYLFVGHWMQGELGHDRKNVGLLVKTFYETFKDIKIKPALILKTSVVGGSHIDKAEIMRRISMIRETIPSNDLPPIYLIHGSLSDAEMNEVYNHPKVKTMVCLTRGEGFGRPLLEFSLIGKPIITTGWSGHTDFLNEGDIGYVGGELEELHPSSQVKDMLLKESKWFKPNLGDVKYLFNDTFKNHGDWVIKAKRQVKISKDRFSYDAMSKKINEIFDVTLPILPKKMELKLPGMDKIKMPKKIKQLKKV